MKKHYPTMILIFVFLVGLSVLLYPSVSNYYNSFHQSRAVASYDSCMGNLTEQVTSDSLQAAEAYNKKLLDQGASCFTLTDAEEAEYNNSLNMDGNGMMGYLSIKKMGIQLPIYHGTSESVLAAGIGHLAGSSLPVGGIGTHCVLSGHRGLPSAKLLTDLDQIEIDDTFSITVLHETLTYEVDQILIVNPDEVTALNIDPNEDYCTLVTCTPYGINTQRLLVRGHRVEIPEETYIAADAVPIDPLMVAPVIAAPILLILLIWLLVAPGKPKATAKHQEKDGGGEKPI
ncbi:MAG: class C sortase [Lawsonibacter sp.]|nr:class C sortase [Lawsonibacter sp.]